MTSSPHRYFILHKPFDMVSQFIVSHEVRCLADLDIDFPQDIHAIGRLDKDSEGLLILTTKDLSSTGQSSAFDRKPGGFENRSSH